MENSPLPNGEVTQSENGTVDNNTRAIVMVTDGSGDLGASDDMGPTTPHANLDHHDSTSLTGEEKQPANDIVDSNTANVGGLVDDSDDSDFYYPRDIDPPTLGAIPGHDDFTSLAEDEVPRGKRRQTFSTFQSDISVQTNVSLEAINPEYADPDRTVARYNTLCHVGSAHAWRSGFDETRDTRAFTSQEQDRQMYSFAGKMLKRRRLVFCRFRRLSVFNVLRAQHKLVLLSEKLHYNTAPNDFLGDNPSVGGLGEALEEYVRAIETFQALDSKKAPAPKSVKPMAANLAHKLHEPHYWDGPDALSMFDITGAHEGASQEKEKLATGKQTDFLSPTDVTVLDQFTSSVGGMRLWFQLRAPSFMLDNEGRAQRRLLMEEVEEGLEEGVSHAGTRTILRDAQARIGPLHISPKVDFFVRLLACLFGGVSIVVPMVILFIVRESNVLTLGLTVVFVLLTGIALAVLSNGDSPTSLESLLGATAAYAAVLVVFVGNASLSSNG